jgi:hypothetical protein
MKYAVDTGSGAMIQIQSFIKFGSKIHKLMTQRHRDTETMEIA